jgi:hypothetical protein
MKLLVITFGILASIGSTNGQTSEYRLRQIERSLHQASSDLAEINARERAKEQAAQKAEEERLVNLPLDYDLQQMYANYAKYIYSNIKNPKAVALALRDTKIKICKMQDARNQAR